MGRRDCRRAARSNGFVIAVRHGVERFLKRFRVPPSSLCWCRRCFKTKERVSKASALAGRKDLVVQKFEMESSVHSIAFERYETRAEFPFALGRQAQNTILIVLPQG